MTHTIYKNLPGYYDIKVNNYSMFQRYLLKISDDYPFFHSTDKENIKVKKKEKYSQTFFFSPIEVSYFK